MIVDSDHVIMPAEYVGATRHDPDGKLRIGTVEIDLSSPNHLDPSKPNHCCWNVVDHTVHVYVRRYSKDNSVIEIHMTRHDGLAEESDQVV